MVSASGNFGDGEENEPSVEKLSDPLPAVDCVAQPPWSEVAKPDEKLTGKPSQELALMPARKNQTGLEDSGSRS